LSSLSTAITITITIICPVLSIHHVRERTLANEIGLRVEVTPSSRLRRLHVTAAKERASR
jgi:hypothetical protein